MDIVKRLLAICAAGVVLLTMILVLGREPKGASDYVERDAPDFTAIDPEGVYWTVHDFALSPTLLCFWLLNKGPEGAEAVSILDGMAQDPDTAGVGYVAVNCDASSEEIAEYVEGKQFLCMVLHMGDNADWLREIARLYRLDEHTLPYFLLIRPGGKIALELEGPQTAEQLRQGLIDTEIATWLIEDEEEDGS